VSPKKKTIEIASNAVITRSGVALAVGVFGKSANEIEPLYGPVATPSPSPSPSPTPTVPPQAVKFVQQRAQGSASPQEFASPLYYEAHGFTLQPRETYVVKVAAMHNDCKVTMIKGALFKTKSSSTPKPKAPEPPEKSLAR
jgi:hypothetical protein